MNLCFKDWNGTRHCVGSVMDQLHGAAPGGLEAGLGILILLAVTIGIFIFKDPA
ncbi:MAG: hypothetical protein AAF366_14885 [Pseudomonadota bacterium]